MAGHRAAGVFQFGGIGQQAVQCVGFAQQLHLRAALLGLRHDEEQLARQVVGIAAAQAFLAVLEHLADAAIDLADQLTHFGGLRLEVSLLEPFQRAGGDPPQSTTGGAVTATGDGVEGVAHAQQLLVGVLPAEPGQQLLLEAQAQIGHAAAARERLGLAHRRWSLRRQRCVEARIEQRHFRQGRHLAAGAQLVEQRQQHHRHVAMSAGQALEVVGQLHEAAHQRGIGLFALRHVILEERDGQRLHLVGDHGGAVQLDHLQGAVHLVQAVGARAHRIPVARVVDVGLQRIAGRGQSLVELRFDPLQGGEIDVVLKSHAPLTAAAPKGIAQPSRLPPVM